MSVCFIWEASGLRQLFFSPWLRRQRDLTSRISNDSLHTAGKLVKWCAETIKFPTSILRRNGTRLLESELGSINQLGKCAGEMVRLFVWLYTQHVCYRGGIFELEEFSMRGNASSFSMSGSGSLCGRPRRSIARESSLYAIGVVLCF